MMVLSKSKYICSWESVIKFILSTGLFPDYQSQLLTDTEWKEGIKINRLWQVLDEVWDTLESTQHYENPSDFIQDYYQHPVWLINAAFSESDPSTIADRLAAIRLISHIQPEKILDYGGGIGTVARLCSLSLPDTKIIDLVDITDFHQVVQSYLSPFSNIQVLSVPQPPYDAVISTEVLEHVPDPIQTVIEINQLLRIGGGFSGSWSFAPCIKCHLPQNFHLKRLMPWIIRSLEFGFYGFERRSSGVYGYIKQAEVTPKMIRQARRLEQLSRLPLPIDRVLLLLRGL